MEKIDCIATDIATGIIKLSSPPILHQEVWSIPLAWQKFTIKSIIMYSCYITGISLSQEQWEKLKDAIADIDSRIEDQ